MLRTLRSSPWLWVVWAALLVAYVALRPDAASLVFLALAAVAVAATIAQMVRSYRRASWEQETINEWNERLAALGATLDLPDDDDVLEMLSAQQWEDVFVALANMPKGARSVQQAILRTHPSAFE